MSKNFNIHDWQDKQRQLNLAEQDDYQKRQDASTPGKNPDAFYGPDSVIAKMRSQESMNNADIRALQKVVGEYSLNKVLNTIAVIADKTGKHNEADMIQKLASQIQDFDQEDPRMDPAVRSDFDDPVIDEQNTTGGGASFTSGDGMGYYGKRKKIREDEEETPEIERSRDVKVFEKILSDRINTKDEWIEMFELLIDHSEEITQITPAVIRTLLQQSLKEI